MSKKKYKKGVKSLQEVIDIHSNIKLEKALENGNSELAGYYKKEITRLEQQLEEKQQKLLSGNKRIKLKKFTFIKPCFDPC